jgi:hypothetical protein
MTKEVLKYGTYHYLYKKYCGFVKDQVPVKIIEETEKRYKIQLLGFTNNKVANQILWVLKKSVKISKVIKDGNNETKENIVYNNKDADQTESDYWWKDL